MCHDFAWRLGDAAVLRQIWRDPAFRVYRGLGNVVLLVWTWGLNLVVWRAHGIDYERFLKVGSDGEKSVLSLPLRGTFSSLTAASSRAPRTSSTTATGAAARSA